MKHHETPLVAMIARLRLEMDRGDLTLGEIFEILKTAGHSIIMIFLCLPFLQPIPIPGLSIPLGVLVTLAAALQLAGAEPWIPERWRRHDLGGPVLRKILSVAQKIAEKISPWMHPRWELLLTAFPMRVLNALVIMICAVLLALPLPVPFSNTVPSLVIITQALAFLEKDGLLLVISHLLFAACLFFFAGIALSVESGLGLFHL